MRALCLASALVCIIGACRGRPPSIEVAVAEVDDGRFPHPLHATLSCTECHDARAVREGRPAIPGAADHAPCDRGECHRQAFLERPGPLCALCHQTVDPSRAGGSPLAPYPPERGRRALASRFSHRIHLDYARMEERVGFHVSCTDCHEARDDGALRPPEHAVCGRCHAEESAAAGMPAMSRCDACHLPGTAPVSRARDLIRGDLRFRHGNHRTDRRGAPILCVECHRGSAQVDAVGSHPNPPTAACVACHDDEDRVPSTMQMQSCETCHATRTRSLGALAPRSHLPARERPEDHTLAFRIDHAAEARADGARCARCHTFMSGSAHDTCDQCHQLMRPTDHTVAWREFDHGQAAATRADRCATCHVGTFCTACHSVPPRSHFPLMFFRDGGHAAPARFNPRACLTCHQVDRFCAQSGCHATVRPPAPRGPRW